MSAERTKLRLSADASVSSGGEDDEDGVVNEEVMRRTASLISGEPAPTCGCAQACAHRIVQCLHYSGFFAWLELPTSSWSNRAISEMSVSVARAASALCASSACARARVNVRSRGMISSARCYVLRLGSHVAAREIIEPRRHEEFRSAAEHRRAVRVVQIQFEVGDLGW